MSNKRKTVHSVIILDASSSMSGDKYTAALTGLNDELDVMRKDTNVNYTVTVMEFGDAHNEIFHHFMQPLKDVGTVGGRGANGMTALYDAVGNTIERVALAMPKGDHALVKIFTDGGENHSVSRFKNAMELQRLISMADKMNIITTFEGTEFDAEKAVQNMGIKKDNVLVHDNTATDIFSKAKMRSAMTMSFSSAVSSDNLEAFAGYSDIKEEK